MKLEQFGRFRPLFYEKMENQWNNITLEEFGRIQAVLKDEGRSAEDRMIALAAIVQGTDEDTILNMPLDEVRPVFALVQGLDTQPKPSRIRKNYNVGRWRLRVAETKDLSVAQWVDYQNYARAGFEEHTADILSVALVPMGKTYNEGYDIDALKQDLRQMPVCDALAVCFFFQRRYLKSMRRTLNCLAGLATVKKGKEWKRLREKALREKREVSALLRSL